MGCGAGGISPPRGESTKTRKGGASMSTLYLALLPASQMILMAIVGLAIHACDRRKGNE